MENEIALARLDNESGKDSASLWINFDWRHCTDKEAKLCGCLCKGQYLLADKSSAQ